MSAAAFCGHALLICPSAALLSEHGIDHLHDEALLSFRQPLNAFDLLG